MIYDDKWITVTTPEDADDFLSKTCRFHDATYSVFKYEPVVNDFRGHQITMSFNVFTVDESNDSLIRVGLEMECFFVERFNFLPSDTYLISSVMFKFTNNSVIWGIEPGPACTLNEFGFSDELTWLKCKKIKWRFCELKTND